MTTIMINLLNAALTVYTIFLFYGIFGKATASRTKIIIILTVLTATVYCVLKFTNSGILRILGITASIFAVSWLFSMKRLWRILICGTHLVISIAVEAISAMAVSALLNIYMDYSQEGLFYVLGVLLSKFLTLLITAAIRLKKNYKNYGITAGKLFIILLVPGSTLSLLLIQYFFIKSVSDDIVIMLTIAYALLILSNIVIFEYIDSIGENAFNQGRIEAAEQIIDGQIKQMETLEQNQKDIMRMRHDQKNAYIGMVRELKNGNVSSVINEMNGYIDVFHKQAEAYPGIMDTVVKIKQDVAAKMHINLCFSNQEQSKLAISPIDMAVILGNALDNAIEATDKVIDTERTIDLLIATKNMNVAIVIKNPVSQNIDVTKLSTDKADTRSHGYGVLSIRQIAARYGGEVIFSCENRIFETCIMLQNINNHKEKQ